MHLEQGTGQGAFRPTARRRGGHRGKTAGALAVRIVNQSARARRCDELAREILVVAVHAKKDIRNSQKAFTRIPPAVYDDFGITPNSCEKEAVNDRKC